MKRIESLGRSLNRSEQRKIQGGVVAGTCQYENPGSYEGPVGDLSRKEAETYSKEMEEGGVVILVVP